jgi:hypothetical protein
VARWDRFPKITFAHAESRLKKQSHSRSNSICFIGALVRVPAVASPFPADAATASSPIAQAGLPAAHVRYHVFPRYAVTADKRLIHMMHLTHPNQTNNFGDFRCSITTSQQLCECAQRRTQTNEHARQSRAHRWIGLLLHMLTSYCRLHGKVPASQAGMTLSC